ncbi:Uma2 family endonuclease [Kineococcus rhizosphaerae]|uniref:Uma2 family endonuclease n=1 Tax=Kineococcus rhizosphaerae TaxID=559628 RepID=A0A2T0R2A8_9ACTN|nr:Uma2 family endonuclease [Kineococcus rhizosphaerae]PRY13942.1 Uma2 family endonuclease [Kineococcus rhizosphaerae]
MDTLQVQGRVRLEDLPEDTAWPKHEIIDGSLLVTPWAGTIHQAVVGDVYFALRSAAPGTVTVYPGANVRHTRDGESDLLIPDVVVSAAGSGDGTYLDSSDVLLTVEVISPSTRLTDTVTKRAVYAEWGVPAYLIIDPVTRTSVWHGNMAGIEWAVDAVEVILPSA